MTGAAWQFDNTFATIGVNHVKFWEINGKNICARPAFFGKEQWHDAISMTFAFDNKYLLVGNSRG